MLCYLRIGKRTQSFALYNTDAPRRYDHPFTIDLNGPQDGSAQVWRYVLVPVGSLEDQLITWAGFNVQRIKPDGEVVTRDDYLETIEAVLMQRMLCPWTFG
jgi:hypothetical protein